MTNLRIREEIGISTSWLLNWNPSRYDLGELEEELAELKEKGSTQFGWNCSRTKGIEAGDRVFLMRVGDEPRGLVASGYATGSPEEGDHWEDEAKVTNYVPVRWEWFDPVPLISREELDDPQFAGVKWSSQASGIRIKGEAADNLEREWVARLEAKRPKPTEP